MSSELLNFADLSREARLNLAKALLDAPALDTETNIKILINIPPAQKNPNAKELIIGVANAQRTYLALKDVTDDSLEEKLCSRIESVVPLNKIIDALAMKNELNDVSGLLDLIEKKVVKPNSDTNELLAATSHYALNIAHRFYQKYTLPEAKMRARTYVLYFAAIETLSLGAETNAVLQALNPEAENLNLDGGPTLTIIFDSKEDLNKCAVGEIFNGGKVMPITKIGDRYITTIIPSSD